MSGKGEKSMLACVLTDVHLWVPVIVLVLGTALLMSLK
jgi:hypothetical protein